MNGERRGTAGPEADAGPEKDDLHRPGDFADGLGINIQDSNCRNSKSRAK